MDSSKLRVSNGSGEAVRALVTSLRIPGSTVINVNTSVNWPTGQFVATAGPLLADGTIDPAKALVFLTHVVGTTLIIDQIAPGYTDTYGNSVSDVVVIKPTTWWADTVAASAESMKTFVDTQGDWRAIGTTVSSTVYNGNRSYTSVLAADKSALLSPGMRLRTTRTTAAPTQSTSLNGTNQYWSKTSPAGMTFTDDFVVSAWVKLSSYPTAAASIEGRFNGTSGWLFFVDPTGQVILRGYNANSANFSDVKSYQSLPLNKWVHVAAQLDMSAFTATTTTSYVMFDGLDVPSAVARGGTNPTALVQAGDFQVGAYAGAVGFFPGKIAQAAVFSAKVTQATMRGYISQGLAGTETSLVSAYSFNGTANDLNTTNANNLTANGSATATNADSPFGGQADGTVSSTKDYAIVQRVAGTSVTYQAAEGCTVPTTGTLSFEYSTMRAPYGFPGQKGKWTINSILRTQGVQVTPVVNTRYNVGFLQLNVPVGQYTIGYQGAVYANRASGAVGAGLEIHTATTGTGDIRVGSIDISPLTDVTVNIKGDYPLEQTAQATRYANLYATTASINSIYQRGDLVDCILYVENAYL